MFNFRKGNIMSYCRSERGYSDVYVFGSYIKNKKIWSIYISHNVGKTFDGDAFHCRSLNGLKLRLKFLVSRGYKVPKEAFDRINKELKNDEINCDEYFKKGR